MKKLAIALAGLAAIGFSGAAFAEEATTGPAAMTDAEMDKVTAGTFIMIIPPSGVPLSVIEAPGSPPAPPLGARGVLNDVVQFKASPY